jgi:hypothetical protein
MMLIIYSILPRSHSSHSAEVILCIYYKGEGHGKRKKSNSNLHLPGSLDLGSFSTKPFLSENCFPLMAVHGLQSIVFFFPDFFSSLAHVFDCKVEGFGFFFFSSFPKIQDPDQISHSF